MAKSRKIVIYDYMSIFKDILSSRKTIKRFDEFDKFIDFLLNNKDYKVILPLMAFDVINFDIRSAFKTLGYREDLEFLLIADKRQIDYVLNATGEFMKNNIDEILLPVVVEQIETLIKLKLGLK